MPNHDPSPALTRVPPADPTETRPYLAETPSAAATVVGGRITLPVGTPAGPGPEFHPYIVSHELARGGMGAVFAAHDPAFDREVAIKVMHPGQDAARFVVEARITARLPHPGVPPVYAIGALPDGRPFLAMKLIQGHTLADEMRGADRPALLATFERICQTVGFAHSRGIIHRDLKPANVMVGSFGEVLVMDWGLAKEVATAGPDPLGGPGAAAGASETVAGSVKGTPAYMAPEQARGEAVDARADVFALGGILAAVLTGKPPFVGTSVIDTVMKAAGADLSVCFAHLDGCGADPDLVALARWCLAARPDDRPPNGEAVAAAMGRHRAGVAERLSRAERERAVAAARLVEVRKRRRVQLALAAVVVTVAVGGSCTMVLVQQQRQEERLKERVRGLVDALGWAPTPEVPAVVRELAAAPALAAPGLHTMAQQDITTKPGLHARLALLSAEPAWAQELGRYLPACRPDELLPVRQYLEPHAEAVAEPLWDEVTGTGPPERRVRAAAALALLAKDDPRWAAVAPAVVEAVVRSDPAEFGTWAEALVPVRGTLLPAAMRRYTEAQARREAHGPTDPVADGTAHDLTAALAARYAAAHPAALAEFAVVVDPSHHALLAPALDQKRADVVPRLAAELSEGPPLAECGPPAGLLPVGGGLGAVGVWLESDRVIAGRERRRAAAAAALIALGEPAKAWAVLKFPTSADPTARSYLIERLPRVGAAPRTLARRLDMEPDAVARQGIVLALGDFPTGALPDAEREPLVGRLKDLYREDPDPGLHSAIGWTLGRWGMADEVAKFAAPFTTPGGAAGDRPVPKSRTGSGVSWFVNAERQTYAVLRGPGPIRFGSPLTEPGRIAANEPLRHEVLSHAFAIATHEVTVDQFKKFFPNHRGVERHSPGPNTPAVGVKWYQAVEYCNRLSEQDGIPRDQWCYVPNEKEEFAAGMKMRANVQALRGYRLPTEDEWEFACRAGAVTARHYGRGEQLLPRYEWSTQIADDQARPVSLLRPNGFGLFDALANVAEWTSSPERPGSTDVVRGGVIEIQDAQNRMLGGGSFFMRPYNLRAAIRQSSRPTWDNLSGNSFGLRPVRTVMSAPPRVRPG